MNTKYSVVLTSPWGWPFIAETCRSSSLWITSLYCYTVLMNTLLCTTIIIKYVHFPAANTSRSASLKWRQNVTHATCLHCSCKIRKNVPQKHSVFSTHCTLSSYNLSCDIVNKDGLQSMRQYLTKNTQCFNDAYQQWQETRNTGVTQHVSCCPF
jgi:hypothetical protein